MSKPGAWPWQEWNADWGSVRKRYGGSAMYGRLNARLTKSPQKIVLLMHDAAFRPAQRQARHYFLCTFTKLLAKWQFMKIIKRVQ